MSLPRRLWLTAASEISWRLPGWPARMLSAFSLAERGSMVDMLAAAEATPRGDLRRKFFLHALDEGRHAGVFAERVRALGARSRADAAVEDAGLLTEHGIVGGKTLYERLGEERFLAFVMVAEADAVEQFKVYLDRRLPDEATQAALRDILKDEAFHVSYSKLECERLRAAGRPVDAWCAELRRSRLWEGWLRFSRDVGEVVSAGWLTLVYLVFCAPFRLLARVERGGWSPPPPAPKDVLGWARAEG